MKQSDNKTMKRGFTIIETLAAIFIITMGSLGIFGLVNQVTSYLHSNSARLVAIYLAQEGIEIARNIRDTNFIKIKKGIGGLEEKDWIKEGDFEACSLIDSCRADYQSNKLEDDNKDLYISSGFYTHNTDEPTLFKRKIIISDIENLDGDAEDIIDKMKVTVEVSWTERGRNYQVKTQENLYRWHR